MVIGHVCVQRPVCWKRKSAGNAAMWYGAGLALAQTREGEGNMNESEDDADGMLGRECRRKLLPDFEIAWRLACLPVKTRQARLPLRHHGSTGDGCPYRRLDFLTDNAARHMIIPCLDMRQ